MHRFRTSVISMSGGNELLNQGSETKVEETLAVALPLNDSDLAVDPPPDGGYGWVCVASVFIINGFTWGVSAVRSIQNSSIALAPRC